MGLTLTQVVPWGRSFDEYCRMFALTPRDRQGRILGCADGPAAFNAELTRQGGRIVSVDPLYGFTADQIRDRIRATYDTLLSQVQAHHEDYVWEAIASVADLGRIRMAAMETFLADYPAGQQAGRYQVGELPHLPYDNGAFDLALSSHFLFLYSDHLSLALHQQAVREMLRVAAEVRIFPLVTLDGRRSPYVATILAECQQAGYHVAIEPVTYEFQRGGHEMLRIRSTP